MLKKGTSDPKRTYALPAAAMTNDCMPNGLKATNSSIFSEATSLKPSHGRATLPPGGSTTCLASFWWLPVLRGYSYIPSLHGCLTSLAQVFSCVSYKILVIGSLANKDDVEY